jgi:hypothetical protein
VASADGLTAGVRVCLGAGYKVSFPFFDEDMNLVNEETNKVNFYKLVFPVNHSSLYAFNALSCFSYS